MTRKTISMPDDMSEWIDKRIKSGQYNNDSEYFRDLIRRDQERQDAIVRLRKLLEEGENSGVGKRSVSDIMNDVEDRLQKNGKL